MMAVAVEFENASVVSEVLFDRWIAVFGPPVSLLSERGKTFCSDIVRNPCDKVGTHKIFTSPYAPQTDGCVERFSATQCRDLAKFLTDEEDWDRHLAFAVFRYNASQNDATGTSPYRALFGVYPFEFDAYMDLELRLEDEPQDVAKRLGEVHKQLYSKSMKSRAIAQNQYDRPVKECSYAVGDRLLIYHFPGLTDCGRKLRVPWIGRYRISAKHSGVGYSAVTELDGKMARVHVNRLKAVPEGREIDASEPEQGLWPDVCCAMRGILSKRTIDCAVEYQVRKAGRKGLVWIASDDRRMSL
jgi:hypothetical protein